MTALFLTITLAGCTILPRSGPDPRVIEQRAAATYTQKPSDRFQTGYALVDIDEHIMPHFENTLLTSFAPGFKANRRSAPVIPVGIGDTVQVTIFEADAGGLFTSDSSGLSNGNFVALPAQTIDNTGSITVPYVGQVRADGRLVSAIERSIVSALENKAIEPQVIVTVTDSQSNQATIIGDGGPNQRLTISPIGERLLDILARSGGISTPAEETYIKVSREGTVGRVLFDNVIKNPQENIFIYPGDTIYVDRERRTFVAMGATGALGRINFEETNLKLSDALGEVAGLDDNLADPSQVFVFRNVDRNTLLKAGVDLSEIHAKQVPTVFRIDFREPASLFMSRRFAVQDKDIVYVSNADSVEIFKVLDFINGVTGSIRGTIDNVDGT